MTTLNDAFATELAQEDEGYESWSETFNMPIPLSRAPRIYHVTMVEDLSFNPTNLGQSPTTLDEHAKSTCCSYRSSSITHHQLVFTSLDDESPVRCSKQCNQHPSTNDSRHDPWEADASYSVHHNLCHPTNPFLTDDLGTNTTSSEEDFPTVPSKDNIWSKEPIPDRCLCIHETPNEPSHQCSYSYPY